MHKDKYPILLIEDNPVDVDLMLRTIKSRNLLNPIQVARNGEEALEMVNAWESLGGAPCLIILDINLPRVDGFAVLKEIKSHPRFKTIPIVILTTSTDNLDLKKCYELGANSYIVKPVDFKQFQDVIKQIDSYWIKTNRTFSGI